MDDDAITIASLSDSKEERLTLVAQLAASQPKGTRSENSTCNSTTDP